MLVTGCGPIGRDPGGALRRRGAPDLAANALEHAARVGAHRVIDMAATPDALSAYAADKGHFDVLYECSGAAAALSGGIAALRPRGVALQLGLGGDMSVPMMQVTAKEIDLRGSFRFHEEFATAVELMRKGRIDVKPLITHTLPLAESEQAFRIAAARSQAMKAQIAFA